MVRVNDVVVSVQVIEVDVVKGESDVEVSEWVFVCGCSWLPERTLWVDQMKEEKENGEKEEKEEEEKKKKRRRNKKNKIKLRGGVCRERGKKGREE